MTAMARVTMTSHLYRFFPALEQRELNVPAGSVAEVVHAINSLAPGFSDYVLDDTGAARRHVMISVNDTLLVDRKKLSDRVRDHDTVYIFQALTGG